MKFIAVIKRRFKKAISVEMIAEDMYWAIKNIERLHPKHKLISIDNA